MRQLLTTLLLLTSLYSYSQSIKEPKLVIVTFDGLRWKDVFRGADSALLKNNLFITRKDSLDLRKAYLAPTAQQRRTALMPFLWNNIATKGQIFGNRDKGSLVSVKNPYRISYAGYNEIFTGYPDTLIKTNAQVFNKNMTLPEAVNKMPAFKDKVAVFAGWHFLNYIMNDQSSGIKVINAGFEPFIQDKPNPKSDILSEAQMLLPRTFGNNTERPDIITWLLAKEYLINSHPRLLQVSFIETDAFAHKKKYDDYISSMHNCDQMLQDLWTTLQQDPYYRDQTTLIITTDHGRGDGPGEEWSHHNSKEPESEQIFLAIIGPTIKPLGEATSGHLYQYQFAQTMAKLLDVSYKPPHPTGPAIEQLAK